MRVKMLVDAPGSPDGITVLDYAEGTVYDVPDDLGDVFLNEEVAEETDEDATGDAELEQTPEPETEAAAAADEAAQAETDATADTQTSPAA